MEAKADIFRRSILDQIERNRLLTPTQRFQSFCDLLDAARAMAPDDPAARERRQRAANARERDRERRRDYFRQVIAADRSDDPARI